MLTKLEMRKHPQKNQVQSIFQNVVNFQLIRLCPADAFPSLFTGDQQGLPILEKSNKKQIYDKIWRKKWRVFLPYLG